MPFLNQETIQQVRNAGITIQENERGIPWESLPITAQPEVPPDTLLIRAYFDLHIRRTLDQYFYTGMKDTTARDQDQVVNRVQRGLMNEQPKIIVVDQLWLWILNEGLALTKAELYYCWLQYRVYRNQFSTEWRW